MDTAFEIQVNGTKHAVQVPGETPLLEVLRDELGLTGTKFGCGEGQCGACTVLIGSVATRSCVTAVSEVGSSPVVTIEGLAQGARLHPLQQAFLDHGSMQCGYCVPGMIMAAHGLLSHEPNPSRQAVLDHMQKNVCRCGGYPGMLAAIEEAAEKMRSGK